MKSIRYVFFFIFFFTLPAFAKAPAKSVPKELSITMGGDVNFNVPGAGVQPHGTNRLGVQGSWDYFTSGIAPLITGDVNFANIETVVTEQTLNSRVGKSFNFQSHTNSIRHLVQMGFNLFSLANNHAYDYGFDGYYSTLAEMQKVKAEYPRMAYHGVGRDLNEALMPVVFKVKGVTIAFAAIGIMDGTYHARADRPGMINIQDPNLRSQLLANLRATAADYRILSVHYGTENQVTLDGGQRAMFNQMLHEGDVDLLIGHHPHVTRPVEVVGHRIIFYSLGNYLMLGAKDMGSLFGLFARVQLKWDDNLQRMRAIEVQAVPLANMHVQPYPSGDAGMMSRLNNLSSSQLGGNAMIFTPQANGSGVYKMP